MRALNPQLRIPMWTSIINFNSGSKFVIFPICEIFPVNRFITDSLKDSETQMKKEDARLYEEDNPVTDDMKRLSLTAESGQEPSTLTKKLQVVKTETVKVIWRYREKNGNWVDYPEKINVILENNYVNGKRKTKWIENGKTYSVSYQSMSEEIVGSDDIVDIKRVEA